MATIGLLSEDGLGYRNSWVSSYAGPLSTWGNRPDVQEEPAEETSPDADWISRVQQGDEDAARELFQRLYPTVVGIVRGHRPKRTLE